ncbi:MAG: cell surface protein SprA [Chitinophagales bacterium]
MSWKKSIFISTITTLLVLMFFGAIGGNSPSIILNLLPTALQPKTVVPVDSIIYPIEDREGDFVTDKNKNPFDLEDPAAIEKQVEYDPETGTYIVTETIGGVPYRYQTYLTFDEYWENRQNNMQQDYFNLKSNEQSGGLLGGLAPKLNPFAKTGFPGGPGEIDIRPTGSIDLFLGFQKQNIRNPSAIYRQNNRVTPDFDMDINVGVTGKIGDNLNLNLDYNTRSIFNFENQIKLEYTGEEDDIIQELRAGNVDFRTPSQLIPGYQNLFGLQSKLQFGRLTLNGVIAEQRTRRRAVSLDNGAQIQEFELTADEYDENRHFFLAQYFRNNFEKALATLPYINSDIYITRMEVYINDNRGVAENVERDIVALADLAENKPFNTNSTNPATGANAAFPSNSSNDLYQKLVSNPQSRRLDQINNLLQSSGGQFRMQDIRDFRKTSARKLSPDEYTYDPQLGFMSLNFSLRSNEVLGVAFEYTTTNGKTYQVGEFAEDVFTVDVTGGEDQNEPRIMFLKMIRSSQQLPRHPMWDLMMKNIYALGAFNVDQQDFKLDILYESVGSKTNPGGDIRYIPEGNGIRGVQLIKLLGLDRLNSSGEPYSDGIFDFIPADNSFAAGQNQNNPLPNILQSGRGTNRTGRDTRFGGNSFATGQNTTTYGTINPKNGRLIFPVLEPFGGRLRDQFEKNGEAALADKYAYDEIYDSTRIVALEFPENNRFLIRGRFKSNISSEISLGAFNIPQGSVRVTAGGQQLVEGFDYIVDYNLGRLSIINSAYVNAGVPINVSFEDQAAFGIQRKTLMGARADYWINDDFTLGATVLKLSERPFTPKVNYGDTPISNTMIGADMNYFKETPGITRFIDKLPGISTKEPSSITFTGEVAALLPGHANAIGKDGNAYIDDFDGSTPEYDIRFPYNAWMLASTPRYVIGDNGMELFPEASRTNDLSYGYNRAKIAWYQLDFVLQNQNAGINTDVRFNANNYYTRTFSERELFNTDTFNPQQVSRTFDVAFYPDERGPYNFDVEGEPGISAGVDENGRLKDPESRWGGIMRNSPFKDFEQANVEFVEFWILDPFIENKNNDGDLYLQLGNVSEDVLKDSKQFYENSLPTADDFPQLDETEWGEVSIVRPINFAFANEQADREAQDLGFDGLTDIREREKFNDYLTRASSVVNAQTFSIIQTDPAADNYLHFRDEFYNSVGQTGANLLERYKNFNNPQGNSPVQDFAQQGQNYTTSATNFPEMEDYNQDKSLSDAESFFEYRVPLRPNMGASDIGNGFLADFKDIEMESYATGQDTLVRFYHFQIPIDNFTSRQGSINFRNIEGIRLFMTGFEDPVVTRFIRFDIVRNNWRKYDQVIREPGEYSPSEPDNVENSFFNLSSVNVEENSQRSPIPYNLPPDIEREILPVTGAQNQRQNEQSISIEVGDLADGEGRGVYRRINMDMRQFGSLRMYIHAEALQNIDVCKSTTLEHGDVTAFIRIGDDFQNNYYEYEIPLTVSRPLSDFAIDPDEDNPFALYPRTENWPEENEINVRIQDLVNAKVERNFAENTSYSKPYIKYDTLSVDSVGDILTPRIARITVVGSPDLGRAKQVMVGVRNPKQNYFNQQFDDGLPKCAEIWFNELRLSDFNQDPALAALTTLDVKLADLGNFTLSGNMHTAGFGTLEDKITERRQDNLIAYDASTNLELGRFLPKSSGIRIPLYAGISQSVSTPKYDPYDTDVLLKQLIDSVEYKYGADSAMAAKKIRKTYETVRSINVTNVRKERTNPEKKPMPWDVENLALTYAYTETEYRDHVIEKDLVKRHRGSIAYVYNARPKYYEPLKNVINQKSKYLRLFRDFNFNLIPNTVSFQTDFNRRVGVLQLRPLAAETIMIDPAYDKSFSWDRLYGVSYNPTRSITIDYNATHQSVIDENQIGKTAFSNLWSGTDSLLNPFFGTDLFFDPGTEYITAEDVGISEFGALNNWGRLKKYEQNINVTYNLPLDKFPLLSWMQLRARYGSNYAWEGKPLILANTLGNSINNDQNIQLNGEMNFTKIYNAFPFLKELNGTPSTRKRPSRPTTPGTTPPATPDTKENTGLSPLAKIFLKPLVSIKRVSISYNEKNSTSIPGFVPVPGFFGQGSNQLGNNFPGWDFILGNQPSLFGWMEWAAREGVVSPSEFLNEQLRQNVSRNLQIKANLEPYRDLKIDLNADLQYSLNHSELFKVSFGEDQEDAFRHLAKIDNGSYTISYLPIGTSFAGVDTQNISNNFRDFERFATVISRRWSELNPASDTGSGQGQSVTKPSGGEAFVFEDGYGYQSQAVLVPAFLAAYGGKDPEKVNLNPFNLIPLPNWKVTFNGLGKIPAIQKIFNNVSISHGYQSTFTINNFQNNLEFDELYYSDGIYIDNTSEGIGGNNLGETITEEFPVLSDLRDTTLTRNFSTFYRVPQAIITERFEPLIAIDFSTVNDLTGNFAWKRSRILAMSFEDYQLAETKSTEIVVGIGYRVKGFMLPFKWGGKKVTLENDLSVAFDFSFRDDLLSIVRLYQDIEQPARGMKTIKFSPSADYMVNDNIRIGLFYEYTQNEPATSESFPITNSRGGLRVNFTF